MKIVIIGGGTAGVAAATKLRRLNEKCEIVILEKTHNFAISNCAFPHYISGTINNIDDLSGISPEEMREQYNIEVHLDSEVESIDSKAQIIKTIGHKTESYDKLIIATGATQSRPEIEGVLSENVFTIHNLESIERIKKFAQQNKVKKVLILGAGYIGIEMAESFYGLGMKITLVDRATHVLPLLDEDMSASLQNMLREKGIRLFLEQSITAFNDSRATLSSGETIDYDMALIATGVKPELKLPLQTGLEIGDVGGIKVNKRMQSSDENIYAIGDNIEIYNGITLGQQLFSSAAMAIKEARVAAENINGQNTELTDTVDTTITPVFEYTAAAAGATEQVLAQKGIKYQKLHLYQNSYAGYLEGSAEMLLKLIFSMEGKILGVQGIGRNGIETRINTIASIMKFANQLKNLEETEIAYAPAYSSGSDAINNLGSLSSEIIKGKLQFAFFEEVNDESELIDIRDPEVFAESHIVGAINIPLNEIRHNLEAIPHNRKVILYCNRGRGAYKAACILINNGFDNIYILSGGKNLYDEIAENQQKSIY